MDEIQEIEVTVHPDGRVSLDVDGAKGKQCLKLTEKLEKILGNEIEERNFKAEYDEAENQEQENVQEQGNEV